MTQQLLADGYDVIVVGSGAGGLVAAIRAHDLGLTVAVMEKAHHYGGTSALSGGGIWVPVNDAIAQTDTVEQAVSYLKGATRGKTAESVLRAYVEQAQPMKRHIAEAGVRFFAVPGYPDYLSDLPGVAAGRSLLPMEFDGALLGEEFFRLRDSHPAMLAFNRYAMNRDMVRKFSARLPGWRRAGIKMLWEYWSDIGWRLKTRRDRRLTMGRALVGALRKAMLDRRIPLFLNMDMCGLDRERSRVVAADFRHHGRVIKVRAKQGVILAAGGFEQNQSMRDQYFPVTTSITTSPAPAGCNIGDPIRIAHGVGAALDNMADAWWVPCVMMPSSNSVNADVCHPLFGDRAKPGVIAVNRLGKRFVNEAVSYDDFGHAMIADQLASGANTPCWLVFDASYRARCAVGALLPAWALPDKRVPPEWWDSIVYRADSIQALAEKMGVDQVNLSATVESMNRAARTGVDEPFGRGQSSFDQYFGAPGHTPNPCLGPLDTPPFYAVSIELSELGTKGGLRVNEHAAVLDHQHEAIPGLYAIGNTTASPFAGSYPGGGVTLGNGMVFGYIAASDIARRRSLRDKDPG